VPPHRRRRWMAAAGAERPPPLLDELHNGGLNVPQLAVGEQHGIRPGRRWALCPRRVVEDSMIRAPHGSVHDPPSASSTTPGPAGGGHVVEDSAIHGPQPGRRRASCAPPRDEGLNAPALSPMSDPAHAPPSTCNTVPGPIRGGRCASAARVRTPRSTSAGRGSAPGPTGVSRERVQSPADRSRSGERIVPLPPPRPSAGAAAGRGGVPCRPLVAIPPLAGTTRADGSATLRDVVVPRSAVAGLPPRRPRRSHPAQGGALHLRISDTSDI